MRVWNVENIRYANTENTLVRVDLECAEFGKIPMSLLLINGEQLHTIEVVKNGISGQMILEDYCAEQNILPYQEPVLIESIPEFLSIYQFRTYIIKNNLLNIINSIIKEDELLNVEWEYKPYFDKDSSLLLKLKEVMKYNDVDINNLFINAGLVK